MNIDIRTIPHGNQRYPTVGDWYRRDDTLYIRVSDMDNPTFEYLVGYHELVEAMLCMRDEVTEASVDAFDIAWEGEGEPGDDLNAPYHKQHQYATVLERVMAQQLGVLWQEYEQAINNLFEENK